MAHAESFDWLKKLANMAILLRIAGAKVLTNHDQLC